MSDDQASSQRPSQLLNPTLVLLSAEGHAEGSSIEQEPTYEILSVDDDRLIDSGSEVNLILMSTEDQPEAASGHGEHSLSAVEISQGSVPLPNDHPDQKEGSENQIGISEDLQSSRNTPLPISSSEEEEQSNSSSQKRRGKPRSKDKDVYISNTDRRTQHAKRTGKQLVNKVKSYGVKTGAKVFLQTQYEGPKATHTFTYGQYWDLIPGQQEKPAISEERVKSAVSEAVKSTLGPLIKEFRASTQPPVPSTSAASLLSPQKHSVASHKKQNCCICHKKDVTKDFLVFESEWIGCTGDGKDCPNFVHADCLGFPGVTNKDVERMPEYFCPEHMSYGRQFKRVGHKYAGLTSAQVPDKEPQKKRSKRGGR